MLLKKLEMVGFKSFADKTEFDFQSGVTAFVGPNGCGKSNVVDAVRWILGEQSAKAVRGTQMADVIFNGTASRRSVGYAEASLTFLNDRGVLPSEYTEVCVTRRLYRSGESEYYLNRQPCRLRDIRQLFMDTGVGVDTYSIIEQGKVDRFIQANSKERRTIFEEAAGISRYKAQRREAQSRLERTKVNLQKVDIKLEEQRKQLRSIKYQAAKARRYREHSGRLREIIVQMSVKNYREWDVRRRALESEIAELERAHSETAAELVAIEAAVREAEAELGALERRHTERREAMHQIQSAKQTAESSIEHNGRRIGEFQDEMERRSREILALEERLASAHDQMKGAQSNLESIRLTIQRQAEAIKEESRKAEAAGEECDRLAGSIDDWKNRTIQIIERATTLRNELGHMDSSRRQELARRARLLGQRDEKSQEAVRIEEQVGQLTGRRDELSGRLADSGATLREREDEISRLTEESRSLDATLRDLRHREAQIVSRRDILQDVEMRAEDVESGAKRLLRDDGNQENGGKVRGMVADLVRADLKYAAAIESALGDAAQYLVTVTESEAGDAAALLRADRCGRAGLIPIRRAIGPESVDAHLLREPGIHGRASDLVRYASDMEPVVRHLLGSTWVVDRLDTALKLSNDGGAGLRFVTLDGERVEPSGAIIGGEPLPRAGIVSRKSELDAIRNELAELSKTTESTETERGRVTQLFDSAETDARTLRKEIEEGNIARLSNENEILGLRQRQKSLREEAGIITAEIGEIEAAVASYDEREKEVNGELASAVAQRDRLHAEMDNARRRLDEQQTALKDLREQLTRLKVELAEKETQRGGIEQSLIASRSAINDLEEQIAAGRERIEEIQLRKVEAESEIAQARADLERLTGEEQALQSELAVIQEQRTGLQRRRDEHVESARAFRAKQEELQGAIQKQRLEEQELRVRLEGLAERVFSEQAVRLEDVCASAELPEGCDWEAIQNEIDELRDKIRRMGGVNEESIDEEEGLETSIVQTEQQRDDLLKAIDDLQNVIRKLNKISREKFQKTFEEVRVNFHDTFRRLFGGGRCDLVLQEEEGESDVLEAGIEVLACPPGKELRSITLMSGGEKTMTTIALLFAIFKAKPSPFCILDEVDAALDESNIDRFTAMLSEFIKDSQFIIITHSKRTVGIADILYGITMQEKGVSRKVSVRVEDVTPLNN
jgi:chromosome segregation protein